MISPTLQSFVDQSRKSGVPESSIRASLLGAQWNPADINIAMGTVGMPAASENILRVEYAGFWLRFIAYFIDALLTLAILYPLSLALDPSVRKSFIIVCYLAYDVLMIKLYGQTVGKMALHICVVRVDDTPLDWGTVLVRETIGRILSGFLNIGYLWIAFDDQKRGWHDLLVKTLVVRK